MDDLISKTKTYVRDYMKHYDSSHDMNHINRVLALAKQIEAAELSSPHSTPLDSATITLASLLHDVGDRKYLQPGQDGIKLVSDFLLANGATPTLAETVQTIANHVSYSSEIKDPALVLAVIEKYPELAVVQDADRLDALGAVGIGRCFTFNAARNAKESMEDAIRHFEEKLVRLAGMMKTETGRRLAVERTERIELFRSWWVEETGATSDLL